MRTASPRTLCLILGGILLLFGVLEVWTHRDDTAWALLFWGVSLLGGGTLVVLGTQMFRSRPRAGLILLTTGAVLGLNATAWTLVLPLFTLYVVVQAWRRVPH